MRHDPQITAIHSGYALPILRATWVLDPDGCRDEVVQHVSDDLGIGILGEDSTPGPARRRGVIWQRHLREALHYLTYGHMVFERRYEPQPDGYMRLVNLGQRPPWTIAHIWVGPDGLVQNVVQTTGDKKMDANRLVWYVTGQEGASWVGISPLRAAFGAWLLKHESWRVHATSIRRFGMGVPQVEAPPGATAAQVTQASQLAAAVRAADQGGVGLPQGFKFSLAGMSGSAPDALGFIEYLDRAIAKSALAGLIELGQTETGSRALGETFLDLFQLSLQSVADDIATTATSGQPNMPGIVTDIVDQNWGEDEPAPRIVCTDVGENYEITAESLEFLTRYGALSPDESLDDWIRKTWRLPARVGDWQPTSRGIPAPGQPGGAFLPAGATPTPQAPGSDVVSEAGPSDGDTDQPGSLKPSWIPPAPPAPPVPEHTAPVPGGTPPGGGTPAPPPGGTKAARRGHVRAAGPRRAMTPVEAASGHDPQLVQQDWAQALDTLLSSYREVVRAQRYALVDQVIAAVKDGRADKLAVLTADPAAGVTLLTTAMNTLAVTASTRMIAEADSQGVIIDPGAVKIKPTRLTRVAQARAGLAAAYLAHQAGTKALQSVRAAAGDDDLDQAAMDAGDTIDTFLTGLSDTPLRDQLGAALTAAQNAGRVAVLEAAPESAGAATYVASEINDQNTCDACIEEDGTEFDTLDDAEAAYPSGGFIDCAGGLRCRGTVIATWGPADETVTPEDQAADLDSGLDFPALADHTRDWGDREDYMLARIYDARGWGPGQVVTQEEFDRLVSSEGYTPVWRGISGPDAAQYAEQWKVGPKQFAGEGIHGSGTYTATSKSYVTRNFDPSQGAQILQIGLSPDAKIISEADIDAKFAADSVSFSADKAAVLNDPGRYAAYLGYDAVRVPRSGGQAFYVILNRAATVTVG
jgi:hypothetical protein